MMKFLIKKFEIARSDVKKIPRYEGKSRKRSKMLS